MNFFAAGGRSPLFENDTEVTYAWYIGDPVPCVGLWKRVDGHEFPIYQNTRGAAVFNTAELEGSIDSHDPTTAFYEALADLRSEGTDPINVAGCEWYESEFIDEMLSLSGAVDGDLPTELGQLIVIAERRVDDGGDSDD